MKDFFEIKEEYDRSAYEFILMELELALTYLKLARVADGKMKEERHILAATSAYTTAQDFLVDATLTGEMQASIWEKLDQLAPLIENERAGN